MADTLNIRDSVIEHISTRLRQFNHNVRVDTQSGLITYTSDNGSNNIRVYDDGDTVGVIPSCVFSDVLQNNG